MPPKFSYGLNLPNAKKPTSAKPNLLAGQKRKKPVFGDSGSEDEGETNLAENQDGAIEITTLGGLDRKNESLPVETDTKPKKPFLAGLSSAKPPSKKIGVRPLKSSIFDDEHDEGQADKPQSEVDAPNKKTYGLQSTDTNKDYVNLAALHTSRKHAKEAEELDPSIYSYDAVYDSIKAKREKPKKTDNGEQESSRYMDALLRSAEVRKRDQLRARDRVLAKEREAEGDEYADKEKFVTAAYRAQQDEVKRMEEEEAKREQEEEERRKKNGGSGMVSFYREMLARDEESHGEAVKAAQEAAEKVAAGETPVEVSEGVTKEKSEADIAAELNARGAKVVVNDEGQVVDKRQLLSAGLNVAPKPKAKPSGPAAVSTVRPGARGPSNEVYAARGAQRARQTEMIAAQLEERARQEEEAEKERQKQLAEKNRSHKTDSDVQSARERYLARKREKEAQAKSGT
ncbi:coiled-coil domain-containing protein 55-domain containing protein [Talaromyces proteolyticus]|uniref:Coiled-coil domain-containing protein 55-domain containing protein n=1 Tax=Talaromyces proteolyticus TaxID=1131652 RepID=A0AAD4KMF3_9EURO|nr:coiled-coil domain-containing protein 55-domain containing protein [Talaromyces proteolyticus]KAH8696043.1 coiled-coil domain-containing protein 55-domain containing protein [Talaromyces proteolyticus]